MPLLRMLLLLPVLAVLCAAADEDWRGTLEDGSHIEIDSATNKATRVRGEERIPLWDGVHRLSNGAVVIVRGGVVIRDTAIIEVQREQAHDRLSGSCMRLVRKVCGLHDECGSHPACDPARQMLALERQELSESGSGTVLESAAMCLEALGQEDYFRSCGLAGVSVCEGLVARVCGHRGECDASEACSAARQLFAMERQDRFEMPDEESPAGAQCRDVLRREPAFFRACGE